MRERFDSTAVGCLLCRYGAAPAQSIREVFGRVKSPAVVARTTRTAVAAFPRRGAVDLPCLGSGVLISADGKVVDVTIGKDGKT